MVLSTCLEGRVNVSLKTVLSRINLADAGHQIVQVSFSDLEDRVVTCAVFSATFLPALSLVTDLPRRNDVLPLDTGCAVSVFARDITTGFEVNPVAAVFTAAVELGGLWCVEPPGDFFGFAEGLRSCRLGVQNSKQADECQQTKPH